MKKINALMISLLSAAVVFSGCGSSADETYAADGGAFTKAAAADRYEAENSEGYYEPDITPQAGLLTAGEWNDNENFGFFRNLLTGERWSGMVQQWHIDPQIRYEVVVSGGHAAVENAEVVLIDADGNAVWRAKTDYSGTAYLYSCVFGENGRPNKIAVYVPDGRLASEAEFSSDFNAPITISIDYIPSDKKKLDLMLLCDTTGSMGDELSYLQTELENVVETVSVDSGADIRLSVGFYRDSEDQYVVKTEDFTPDIDKALKVLNKQSADGGGDYPEAVHTALDKAVNGCEWRDNSTKLLFIVLDAPPHSAEDVKEKYRQVMQQAAEKGIRIIPVVSSGSDDLTEYLMRCTAAVTGGTYTFLTDDSGVGNSHAEPTVGDYSVEKLNAMMIRLIKEYLGVQVRENKNTEWSENEQAPAEQTETEQSEEGFTDEEIDGMMAVDEAIQALISDSEYQSLSYSEQGDRMEELLISLAENGTDEIPYPLIVKRSIYRSEEMITFEYVCGGGGGVQIIPHSKWCN